MKKLICILLVFILPQIIFANQRYHFSNLSVQNGLSQLHVTCIYQDRLGYMWFGTRNGLNKFNGNNFETFWNHADDECSISNNTIACITEDAEGNLWFGTENGLNKLDKRRNGFKRYYFDPEANAANNKIISLFTDKEGTLWVGTISGLYVFDAKEDILKEIPLKELANNSISTIIEKDDLLYIASSMSGLVIYDPRKNRVVRSYRKDSKTLPIPSNYIKDVYIDKKERSIQFILFVAYHISCCPSSFKLPKAVLGESMPTPCRKGRLEPSSLQLSLSIPSCLFHPLAAEMKLLCHLSWIG